MIHFSKILTLAQRKDKYGKHVSFSLKFVKVSTGEIVSVDKAFYTSSYHKGSMNIRIAGWFAPVCCFCLKRQTPVSNS